MGGSTGLASGYVEALGTNGEWGGVCDDQFDIYDAHVICRMLGFANATAALASSLADDYYGTAPSGDIFVLDDLQCTGIEDSIFDCTHNGEWIENCNKNDIAGVQCARSKP